MVKTDCTVRWASVLVPMFTPVSLNEWALKRPWGARWGPLCDFQWAGLFFLNLPAILCKCACILLRTSLEIRGADAHAATCAAAAAAATTTAHDNTGQQGQPHSAWSKNTINTNYSLPFPSFLSFVNLPGISVDRDLSRVIEMPKWTPPFCEVVILIWLSRARKWCVCQKVQLAQAPWGGGSSICVCVCACACAWLRLLWPWKD